jgi:hypothetical protein
VVVVGSGEKGLPIIGAIPMAHGEADVLTGLDLEPKGEDAPQDGETADPLGTVSSDTASSPASTTKTGNHETKP